MWQAFHKAPFAVVPDPDNSFGQGLEFYPLPGHRTLDKTGKILFVHIGAFEGADQVSG